MYEIKLSQTVKELENEDWDYNHPDWIEDDLTGEDIEAIQYGGCASGAYMPAVTYHEAAKTMNSHGNEVLEFVENYRFDDCFKLPFGISWDAIAVHFLSLAVELWASCFNVIDDDDEDFDDEEE